jgi:demethylmenaquinone methyltransferase/2-methoxy-6-polyprenyl-1,4-benzoquinol methylase
MSRASLDKQPREVAAMFDGVSSRYDRTNTLLSFGLDRSWRRSTRLSVALAPGESCLDLAAGTLVSTEELSRSGAFVVGADLSQGMLRVGHRDRPGLPALAADALALPFPDACFDAVTISFGLRNISRVGDALRELLRVTRPGGRLVVCEFSQPVLAPLRGFYLGYLMRALPAVARRASSNPDAYVYLAESIRAWPAQSELATLLEQSGWTTVTWRNLTGGIVALHHAVRPSG